MNKLVTLIVSGSLLCSANLFAAKNKLARQPDPLTAAPTNTTTANWGAQIDFGVGISNTALPAGDLVMIGTFSGLNNSQIAAASFSQLQAAWVQFGSGHIGDGTSGTPGTWTLASGGNSATTLGIVNKAVYYWVLDAASFGSATRQGIFTSGNSAWVWPNDGTNAQNFTTDLDQVPHDSTGILWGSFGTGTFAYNLALIAVPEPSTLALFGFALLAAPVVYLGRRKVK